MTVDESQPGIRLSVGISGSGKTYGLMRSVWRAARLYPVIVLDSMHEWSAPPSLRAARVVTVDDAFRAIDAGFQLAVLQRRAQDDMPDALRLFDWACHGAEPGAPNRRETPRGIVFPEADTVFPNHGGWPSAAARDVVCRYRHFRVSMWLDTQRLSLINRTLVEQAGAGVLRIYATTGDADRARLRELGGRELESAVLLACERYRDGEKGWHVALKGGARMPPYTLTREVDE